MLVTDLELEVLVELVAKKIMRIVNKHHSNVKEDIAIYRREVRHLQDAFAKLQQKYTNALGEFQGKHDTLPERLQDVKDCITSHSIGVQNVYDKFQELVKRQQEIEDLLKSDKIKEVVRLIPTERDIDQIIRNVEMSDVGKLNKHLEHIRDELERLTDIFN